ncbi:hypothetical protein EVAR_7722_1 [Eumeta japonica]|uniref:Uncharacterized protein n=1 Tax=Eumeta variegata TaxID=151549 RepID=A0A4C1TJZ6_EUMVA|nr:hypothetical protein EVAR_7722_1 [Eumeta japonica]
MAYAATIHPLSLPMTAASPSPILSLVSARNTHRLHPSAVNHLVYCLDVIAMLPHRSYDDAAYSLRLARAISKAQSGNQVDYSLKYVTAIHLFIAKGQNWHQDRYWNSRTGIGSENGTGIDINNRTMIRSRIDNENGSEPGLRLKTKPAFELNMGSGSDSECDWDQNRKYDRD